MGGGAWGLRGGGGVLSRSYAVSAPADRDASQLYYSCLIISAGGKGGGGHLGYAWRGGGGGPIRRVVVGCGGGGGGGWGEGGIPVYTMQLGSSRHPRALRVRSTIQLTSIVTKGMTKSSEIDVINNGDDDECSFTVHGTAECNAYDSDRWNQCHCLSLVRFTYSIAQLTRSDYSNEAIIYLLYYFHQLVVCGGFCRFAHCKLITK